MKNRRDRIIAVAGGVALMLILVLGTVWTGRRAKRDTEDAAHSVSLLYLDELAGRREQVVENNLNEKISVIRVAVDMLTDGDLRDKSSLETY